MWREGWLTYCRHWMRFHADTHQTINKTKLNQMQTVYVRAHNVTQLSRMRCLSPALIPQMWKWVKPKLRWHRKISHCITGIEKVAFLVCVLLKPELNSFLSPSLSVYTIRTSSDSLVQDNCHEGSSSFTQQLSYPSSQVSHIFSLDLSANLSCVWYQHMSAELTTFYSQNSGFQAQISYIYFLIRKIIYFPAAPTVSR